MLDRYKFDDATIVMPIGLIRCGASRMIVGREEDRLVLKGTS